MNRMPSRPFGVILKGVYDERDQLADPEMTGMISSLHPSNSSDQDPLLFHGRDVKKSVYHFHQKTLERGLISRIYANWQRGGKMTNQQPESKLTTKEFKVIKSSSRIFHVCRVPMFMNSLRRLLFEPAAVSRIGYEGGPAILAKADLDKYDASELHFHAQFLESFLRQYIQYLQSIGIADFVVDQEAEDSNAKVLQQAQTQHSLARPRTERRVSTSSAGTVEQLPLDQDIQSRAAGKEQLRAESRKSYRALLEVENNVVAMDPMAVYFQRILHGGVLLLELSFDSIYVVLNVYISDVADPMAGLSQQYSATGSRGSGVPAGRRLFLESTAQLKHKLHLNSFVYDYHLRNLHALLVNRNVQVGQSMDVCAVLKDLFEFYPQPRSFSRNLLRTRNITTNIRLPMDSSQKEFFEYICKNARRFGVQNLHERFQGTGNCLLLGFTALNQRTRSPEANVDSVNQYSHAAVLVFEESETASSEGEDLAVAGSSRSRVIQLQLKLYLLYVNETVMSPLLEEESQQQYHSEELIQSLEDSLTRKINQIIAQCRETFKLDSLWRWATAFQLGDSEMDDLLRLCSSVDLQQIDPSLKGCFSNRCIPWPDLILELVKKYGQNIAGCIIRRSQGDRRHFLLRCLQDDNILLHMEFDASRCSVSVSLLRKRMGDGQNSCELFGSNSSLAVALQSNERLAQCPREDVELSEVECHFVSQFVNSVTHMLWRYILLDNNNQNTAGSTGPLPPS